MVPIYNLGSWWLPVLPVIYCSFFEAQLEQTVRWTLSGSWAWQLWQARPSQSELPIVIRNNYDRSSSWVAWTSRLVMTSWVWRTTCCSPMQGQQPSALLRNYLKCKKSTGRLSPSGFTRLKGIYTIRTYFSTIDSIDCWDVREPHGRGIFISTFLQFLRAKVDRKPFPPWASWPGTHWHQCTSGCKGWLGVTVPGVPRQSQLCNRVTNCVRKDKEWQSAIEVAAPAEQSPFLTAGSRLNIDSLVGSPYTELVYC